MASRADSADIFTRETTQPFIALPWGRLPVWLRVLLVLATGGVLAAVGYLGATNYPNTAPPVGSAAERQLVETIGQPATDRDSVVDGDFLIERFYAVDTETGDRYVADLVKGRVQDLQESFDDKGAASYSLLLDLQSLQRDKAIIGAFVSKVAQPDEGSGFYLGLRVPAGANDAFRVNYDGTLPPRHIDFHSPDGANAYDFLVEQRYTDVTASPQLINVEGFNYLLSNTDQFPYFRSEFGINKAVFLSELILVDATSRQHATTYYRLLNEYGRSPAK